jgi:hypothetical protein
MMPPNVLLKDEFRRGFDLAGAWALVSRPPSFVADDGVVSASDQGLHVKAAGTNPLTGEPAFSRTSPGSSEDHVKWMADHERQRELMTLGGGFYRFNSRRYRCQLRKAGL